VYGFKPRPAGALDEFRDGNHQVLPWRFLESWAALNDSRQHFGREWTWFSASGSAGCAIGKSDARVIHWADDAQ